MNCISKKLCSLFLLSAAISSLPTVLCMEKRQKKKYATTFVLKDEIMIPDSLTNFSLHPSDHYLFISSYCDNTTRIFDLEKKEYSLELNGIGSAHLLECSNNGRKVLISTIDKDTYLWTIDLKPTLLKGYIKPLVAKGFNYNDTKVLTALNHTTLCLWNAQTGELFRELTDFSSLITSAAFSPTNTTILIQLDNHTIHIASEDTGVLFRKIEMGYSPISLLFENKGNSFEKEVTPETILSSSFNKEGAPLVFHAGDASSLIVYNPLTYDQVLSITSLNSLEQKLITIPYSNLFLFKEKRDSNFSVFNSEEKKKICYLTKNKEVPSFVACSPDEQLILASFPRKRMTMIWNSQTGKYIATLQGCVPPNTTQPFNKDGTTVFTKFGLKILIWSKERIIKQSKKRKRKENRNSKQKNETLQEKS